MNPQKTPVISSPDKKASLIWINPETIENRKSHVFTMSSDLEVDDSAKTLIASWFGIDSSYENESKNLEDMY